MRILGSLAAAAMATLGLSCGSRVDVDTDGSGGSDATGPGSTTSGRSGGHGDEPGAAGSTSTDGSGGASVGCAAPDPVGRVEDCAQVASVGTGLVECSSELCDAAGNTFVSHCLAGMCLCVVNGAALCTCATPSGSDVCAGDTPPCCPFPPPP
ncbi:hypothetical protein [Sorangium sp. So ce131]|uniref:hypothetical protein n=1 Tax=Sorangium sp. So ce131 TaxID=3133282 RepID=UPI003F609F9D